MKATIYFTVGNKVGHIDVDLSGTALYTENDDSYHLVQVAKNEVYKFLTSIGQPTKDITINAITT